MKTLLTNTIALLAALAFAASCSKHDHDHHDHDHAGHNHAGHDHNHDHAKHDHTHAQGEKHDNHDHAAHAHDHGGHSHAHGASESTAVAFNAKNGLTLEPATAAAINLTTGRIATRPLAHRLTLNATIIDPGPPVVATAFVPPDVAADMEAHPHDGIRLRAVNRTLAHATGQVEIKFTLAENPAAAPAIGDTLAIAVTGPAETKLAIPNAAILRTVGGVFAYVRRNDSYQRTPVALGLTDGTHTEILSGLSVGDEIAITAVEQLWLTELRLTKGGGHSH